MNAEGVTVKVTSKLLECRTLRSLEGSPQDRALLLRSLACLHTIEAFCFSVRPCPLQWLVLVWYVIIRVAAQAWDEGQTKGAAIATSDWCLLGCKKAEKAERATDEQSNHLAATDE